MKQIVYVEGMHCSACSARVIRVLEKVEGVEAVSVSLENKSVELTVKVPLEESLLQEKIEALGFDFVRAE